MQEELGVRLTVREEELSVLVNSMCKGPEAEGNLACTALKRGQRDSSGQSMQGPAVKRN